ncbi:MAG TPA: DNA-processing protein DprA [Thermoanaerobaculia bacterium]|jgi:DNA processing protein|nr:DNA-processing protein DprA [Thermoanaerobaculia bacterium]
MAQSSSPAELLGPLNEVERKHAPAALFHAGDVALLKQRRVAVVGSRSTSEDGLRRAARLARELVAAEVVVVSGLAEGIDTAAHRAAITAGGRTIAVLGNPLSTFYPRQNRELQETIAREHLLLSQFTDGVPPRKDNFPMRNRTMALVSQATVIVDAQERSGTVSQGWEAIRLGRPLYLLRSLAENAALQWPGLMLQYGAEVLDDVAALVADLPPRVEPELAEVAF